MIPKHTQDLARGSGYEPAEIPARLDYFLWRIRGGFGGLRPPPV